ncbi:hypothetical protein [Sphingomonas sp. URHD0057]|uniref:hypothetical protein n=1 Tax=Sphingomonas sp. URHD0057 TaxID=1380389 RepID=UPI0012DE830C|nr:hypothetical protein [Sphingomonas sp. URHD0057]
MIFDQELIAYFSTGKVQPHATVAQFVAELVGTAKETSGPKLDAAIREAFPPEFAAKLVGKAMHDRVDDDPFLWGESEEPRAVDPGFFVYATEIDWEKGTLWADWIPDERQRVEFFFQDEEVLSTEFEMADFEALFAGLKFQLNQIEMLLPNFQMPAANIVSTDRLEKPRAIGRPPKWNWEGALAFVISQAQLPDGLPTGPGAQARIEEMMSGWFLEEAGDTPAPSLVRQRAATIIRSLERPETPRIT